MPFNLRLPVRFGDCDPAGFVYYPVLYHYFHLGLEEFVAARCAISYARLMAEHRLGFPTVHVESDFAAPLVYGDEFDLGVAVTQMGNSSATFEYRIARASDDAECARSDQVHVCLNLDTRRATPIPDWIRNGFASGA
jgi:YbgC/YbaW family acyl-CoA thioester hydrolase